MSENPALKNIIIQKIRQSGPISFRDFMEMALYYPELGYYMTPGDKIGKRGDFYTTPEMTSLFGKMIGKQLEQMWELMGRGPFIIVEYGAGPGNLCHDMLEYISMNNAFYDHINYCILEKSSAMRERERTHLKEKVSWINTLSEIPGITGCIISNELPDNFAVQQVIMKDELQEVFVDYDDGFKEVLKPASAPLLNYFKELGVTLQPGFRTEVNLQVAEWLKEISAFLNKGYVITIDYGFSSNELYNVNHSSGTLACYYHHTVHDDPYIHIGQQDITTHVNFSAIKHWGNKYGLDFLGYTNQACFLRGLGIAEYLRTRENSFSKEGRYSEPEGQMVQTLLMDMGCKFKVLIQQKGLPKYQLSGMQFSNHLD